VAARKTHGNDETVQWASTTRLVK